MLVKTKIRQGTGPVQDIPLGAGPDQVFPSLLSGMREDYTSHHIYAIIRAMRERVAVYRCESYEQEAVDSAVQGLLDSLGGLSSLVKPGDRVLLKPNLLSARPPEDGVTTHPTVVRSLAALILSAGGRPAIGDSPSGTVRNVEEVFERTGMKAISQELGLELVNFDREGCHRKDIRGRIFYISKPALDADLLINLPKLKTHNLTVITAAVKNMFGVIPGYRKSEYHRLFLNPNDFSELLLDIYSLCRPDLTLADAIVSMDGDGPSNGRLRRTGLILGGRDAVSVDRVIARIVGCPPSRIPTLRVAERRHVGVSSLDQIEVVGEAGTEIPDFRLPSLRPLYFIPSPLGRLVGGIVWVRPSISPARCTACSNCVESCPPKAMVMGSTHPAIDYRRCISCGCCAELCPSGAISLKKSPLLRWVTAE